MVSIPGARKTHQNNKDDGEENRRPAIAGNRCLTTRHPTDFTSRRQIVTKDKQKQRTIGGNRVFTPGAHTYICQTCERRRGSFLLTMLSEIVSDVGGPRDPANEPAGLSNVTVTTYVPLLPTGD